MIKRDVLVVEVVRSWKLILGYFVQVKRLNVFLIMLIIKNVTCDEKGCSCGTGCAKLEVDSGIFCAGKTS